MRFRSDSRERQAAAGSCVAAHAWRREENVSRPVSRVLSGGCPPRRPFIWGDARTSPRATNPGSGLDPDSAPRFPARPAAPIWSCSRWGLPCHLCCQRRGALLPHHFTLAVLPKQNGGLISVALSLGSPPAAVSRHRGSMEPGLSSAAGCIATKRGWRQRPSGRLTGRHKSFGAGIVKGSDESQTILFAATNRRRASPHP